MEYPQLVGIKELSEKIGVKENTIYHWIHSRQIPFVKLGGRVKFDLKDISKWIESCKVKTLD